MGQGEEGRLSPRDDGKADLFYLIYLPTFVFSPLGLPSLLPRSSFVPLVGRVFKNPLPLPLPLPLRLVLGSNMVP